MHATTPAASRTDPSGGRVSGLPFSAWIAPLWIALLAWLHWSLQLALMEQVGPEIPDSMRERFGSIAAFATAARLAVAVLETAFYCAWWASWGRRLPFVRACFWMLTVSALDLLSGNLTLLAVQHGAPLSGWLAILAGPNALRTGISSANRGLWLAFGSAGLLAAARILATAAVQSSLMRSRFAPVLAAVATFWAFTRLVMWWGADLLSGRNALP